MKKYIFMAVAGMLALSSCSNDNDEIIAQNAPRQMTFTAGFGDGAQTRATLDGSTMKVKFDDGDAISILSANNTNTSFTTTGADYDASATFTGTATADSKFYAVYPYADGRTLSGDVISGVKIPMFQNAAATSACGWDKSAPIAYATTTGTSLTFKNACALLKVTNNRDYAYAIGLMCNEALSGTFSLNTSDRTLTYSAATVSSDDKQATVLDVPNGKTIYIAIAPGTKTNFKAVWSNGITGYKKTKASVNFEAGMIYDLGNTSAWTEPDN